MDQPPVVRGNERRIGWWEYPVIALIAMSATPAYVSLLMAVVGTALVAFHSGTNTGGRLQAWGDLARFFAMATGPVGVVICIVVSVASFRSRATKLGWLIIVGGTLAWFVAGSLIGRP